MHRVLVIAAGSIVLAACENASAIQPDSHNPAHCAAALNAAAVWNESDIPSARPDWATQFRAAQIYEMAKIRKSGRSPTDAEAEGIALTKAYAKDPKMAALAVECMRSDEEDPQFKAELPHLLEMARRMHSAGS